MILSPRPRAISSSPALGLQEMIVSGTWVKVTSWPSLVVRVKGKPLSSWVWLLEADWAGWLEADWALWLSVSPEHAVRPTVRVMASRAARDFFGVFICFSFLFSAARKTPLSRHSEKRCETTKHGPSLSGRAKFSPDDWSDHPGVSALSRQYPPAGRSSGSGSQPPVRLPMGPLPTVADEPALTHTAAVPRGPLTRFPILPAGPLRAPGTFWRFVGLIVPDTAAPVNAQAALL